MKITNNNENSLETLLVATNQIFKKPERWETLYQLNEKYKEDLETMRMQEKQKREENENFSFKPKLISQKINTSICCSEMQKANLENRNLMWMQQRALKVKELKEKEKQKELEGCTFAPKLNSKNTAKYLSKNKENINSTVQNCHKIENQVIFPASIAQTYEKRKTQIVAEFKKSQSKRGSTTNVAENIKNKEKMPLEQINLSKMINENTDFKAAIGQLHQNLMEN